MIKFTITQIHVIVIILIEYNTLYERYKYKFRSGEMLEDLKIFKPYY